MPLIPLSITTIHDLWCLFPEILNRYVHVFVLVSWQDLRMTHWFILSLTFPAAVEFFLIAQRDWDSSYLHLETKHLWVSLRSAKVLVLHNNNNSSVGWVSTGKNGQLRLSKAGLALTSTLGGYCQRWKSQSTHVNVKSTWSQHIVFSRMYMAQNKLYITLISQWSWDFKKYSGICS